MFKQHFTNCARRAYASAARNGVAIDGKKSRFDKTALKPMITLLLFGSILTSVSAQQQKHADMVRRYEMKIRILDDLIDRSKKGDFNYNASKELELVNKLFERHQKGKSVSLEEEAKMIREQANREVLDRNTVIKSLNAQMEEEPLEALFQDIMKDIDAPISQQTSPVVSLSEASRKEGSDDIIVDREWLKQEEQNEKKRLAYKPSTDKHVIVETPGEYNTAAEDTKVKKFL